MAKNYYFLIFLFTQLNALENIPLLGAPASTRNFSHIHNFVTTFDGHHFTIKIDESLERGAQADLDTKNIHLSRQLIELINTNDNLTPETKFEIALAYGKEKFKDRPFRGITWHPNSNSSSPIAEISLFGTSALASMAGIGSLIAGACSDDENERNKAMQGGSLTCLIALPLLIFSGSRLAQRYNLEISLSKKSMLENLAQKFACDQLAEKDLIELLEKIDRRTCPPFSQAGLKNKLYKKIKEKQNQEINIV